MKSTDLITVNTPLIINLKLYDTQKIINEMNVIKLRFDNPIMYDLKKIDYLFWRLKMQNEFNQFFNRNPILFKEICDETDIKLLTHIVSNVGYIKEQPICYELLETSDTIKLDKQNNWIETLGIVRCVIL